MVNALIAFWTVCVLATVAILGPVACLTHAGLPSDTMADAVGFRSEIADERLANLGTDR